MNAKIKKYVPFAVSLFAIIASLWSFLEIANFVKIDILSELLGVGITFLLLTLAFEYLIKKEKTVFIVYSYEDKDTVNILIEQLKEKKYHVLSDEELIKPGDNIANKINEAISKSNKIILVLSPSSMKSKWVNIEMKKIVETKKLVVPIMVKQIDEIPDYLTDIKYADLTSNEKKEQNSLKTDLTKFVESLN